MKNFNRLFFLIILLIVAIFAGFNLYIMRMMQNESSRTYRVEINRVSEKIKQGTFDETELSAFTAIARVTKCTDITDTAFFEGEKEDYAIRCINRVYYRFDYYTINKERYEKIRISANIGILLTAILVILFLFYMKIYLLKPFHTLKNVPYELSKGNLMVPLKENKNRFFGRFIWGLDLLRENIEEQKNKEYALQREKKTLILSISHDIKTPLSAIKLYAKALSKKLYSGEEKQIEIAENINKKADEIENFISQIIKASSEDFLNLEVHQGEFYLSNMIEEIVTYYTEKFDLLKIEFDVGDYSNCIMKGDLDRSVEVLQNIMENAIKYGDGHRISLSISKEEDCRLVTISNSGCTLSQNEMPHIFESFWRGSNVGGNSGSGLGLYICRQLMHKMDGDIFAQCHCETMHVTAVFRQV